MEVTQFDVVFRALHDAGVEFITVGGAAGTAHGSVTLTRDLDVVYSRTRSNMVRLKDALAPFEPYLRGAPPGLPFRWDVETLAAGLNFTLETTVGNVDLLGEVAGGGTYEQLLPHSELREAFGTTFRCVSLQKLILLKRAAGRVKDLNMIGELEALLEERQKLERGDAG